MDTRSLGRASWLVERIRCCMESICTPAFGAAAYCLAGLFVQPLE